ncbi:transcriptional repressor LexA [Nitrincola tapanii]|uniref:LexA repressor n=1 Tax=Nitrincola tapanii TaxID=1708751 RepID=A0A5A9W5A4_9GAMM|nr:transcriptional repressor LexA [Nitrincola tapanii]KAA0875832.1 transcriptional repressor LexA [Nitrincola tapanii]
MKLTQRQERVLDCIRAHIEETGYPPTRAEIAKILGFRSANAAEEHLRALERKGAIEIMQHTSRGIRLPDLGQDTPSANTSATAPAPTSEIEQDAKHLPIIGLVAAGSPVLAVEHVEEHCAIAPEFFNPPAHYLLRVRGMSMKNIGILDGDLLAVHQTHDVRNGQIVVARVGDEVTVKRFQRQGSHVSLIAENEEFAPIELDLSRDELTIEGLGVGVIRQGS